MSGISNKPTTRVGLGQVLTTTTFIKGSTIPNYILKIFLIPIDNCTPYQANFTLQQIEIINKAKANENAVF